MKNQIMEIIEDVQYKALNQSELMKVIKVSKKNSLLFTQALEELEEEGRIFKTKKNKYISPNKAGLVPGILSRSKKGFGFVIPFEEDSGDIYIANQYMNGAMDGDTVMAFLLSEQVKPGGAGSREGEIKKILKHNASKYTGNFEGDRKYGFVTDTGAGEDIFISSQNIGKAKNGDKVVVEITAWPKFGKRAEGRILEVLGKAQEPDANMKALIWQHGLELEFPAEVLAEAKRIAEEIPPAEINRREDLRGKTIVTIDGATAKDLDDAISVEQLENGNYLLGVHIADVSHYVKAGSRIDKEAERRGTSVYFINHVIPMLPERLSNEMCSLNPHIARLTLTCEMEIDQKGRTVAHRIYESVIATTHRLIYTDISDLLEKNDPKLIEKYKDILQDLNKMAALAELLNKIRMKHGSMNFDFDEAIITVDEKEVPIHIELAERRIANKLIEEFMLRANETVAEHFFWLEIPFLYRIHENPDQEKIATLKEFIWNFGYKLKGSEENIHPKALNAIIEAAKGKPEEHIINTLILRSMKKASYSDVIGGHFGLGFKYYSHFTSPIRRYPDLLIHRIIKLILTEQWNEQKTAEYLAITREVAKSSSAAERNAEKMEREAEKLKMTEYMSAHLGEEFDGILSGAVSTGFFVQIENTIEGFVSLSTLTDDYYVYDREKYKFIGERTKKIYSLGDSVRVKVVSADIQNREITFALI